MSNANAELDEIAKGLVDDGTAHLYFRATDYGQAARYDGPCPGCEHLLSQTRPVKLIVFGMRGDSEAASPGYADFACDCGQENTRGGCGATFSLEVAGGAP